MNDKLELKRTLKASPARVFAAWTQAEHLLKWFAPGPMQTPVAEIDLRVGGHFRTVMQSPDGTTHEAFGVFHEVTKDERVVLTWQWRNAGSKATLLSVMIAPSGNGSELTLLHEALPSSESATEHKKGWVGCLDKLETLLGA
ncbi:MAG: SRPBCC domain-containing protein [Myxococcales bacterium]|nr:SRPBCC domain-containing protein [Myxococcales bacterium]